MSDFLHPTISPWGYTYDAETLPDFITAQEFTNFTNGKFSADDKRIPANITSASGAIRNYCGWHISPSLSCGVAYNVYNLRDAFIGSDLMIQLPATFVTAVKKVVLNAVQVGGDWLGDVIDDPERTDLQTDGMLKIYNINTLDRRSRIFVKYTAGLTDAQNAVVKELTAHRVAHACSSSYGISSEAAGGVSVTYNAAWAGNTRSTALPDDNREALDAYRLRGVF